MTGPRIAREKKTVAAMVRIYCRGNHQGKRLCADCVELLDYSTRKLDRCQYSEAKPACSKCHVHCYEQTMRDRMRSVMRYSGPRMLPRHPLLTILHSVDGRTRRRRHDQEEDSGTL